MAVTTNTQFNLHGFSTIKNFFAKSLHALDIRIQKARTQSTLSALSDRELEDIGLTRSEIPSVVKNLMQQKS